MGLDELLVLGLGISSSSADIHPIHERKLMKINKAPPPAAARELDLDPLSSEPSLSLNLCDRESRVAVNRIKKKVGVFGGDEAYSGGASRSFSTASVTVKRERDEQIREIEVDEENGFGFNERKKLRLTRIQSAHLEDCFKLHSTLTPRQKQDLARELKLRPRQVEVWFQNRRARTKLKQTELDCEFLKKCYDNLTDENRRLQKELKELKAFKYSAPPLVMHLPATTLTMCPSCEKTGGGGVPGGAAKRPFSTAPCPKQPFCNPSAAC